MYLCALCIRLKRDVWILKCCTPLPKTFRNLTVRSMQATNSLEGKWDVVNLVVIGKQP